MEGREIRKVGSPASIVELFSVISRLYYSKQILLSKDVGRLLTKLPEEKKILAIVTSIILDWGIEFPRAGLELKRLSLAGIDAFLPEFMAEACKLSARLRLRTMDNIHMAFAKLVSEIEGLDYVITSDEELLRKRALVKSVSGLELLSPTEFISLKA